MSIDNSAAHLCADSLKRLAPALQSALEHAQQAAIAGNIEQLERRWCLAFAVAAEIVREAERLSCRSRAVT